MLGFNEAMASPNEVDWHASVDWEHERMLKNGVWEVVDHNNVPEGADIIDSMWTMKKKVNGDYHTELAARSFKQTQGKPFIHHDSCLWSCMASWSISCRSSCSWQT